MNPYHRHVSDAIMYKMAKANVMAERASPKRSEENGS